MPHDVVEANVRAVARADLRAEAELGRRVDAVQVDLGFGRAAASEQRHRIIIFVNLV